MGGPVSALHFLKPQFPHLQNGAPVIPIPTILRDANENLCHRQVAGEVVPRGGQDLDLRSGGGGQLPGQPSPLEGSTLKGLQICICPLEWVPQWLAGLPAERVWLQL